MSSHDKPPSGGSRFLKLASLTAQVAGGYAAERVTRAFMSGERAARHASEHRQRAGERIASTLGELKGAAMKLGQMASMASDLLPRELAETLQTLQRQAPPVDFSVIEEQIRHEFDQPIERLFDTFEREPFAAASIGQVHRARVDGREVICKVQYPGVDAAVDSDMRHLRLVLLASGLLQVDKRALDATLNEIRARMHEELDYCNESDNVRAFRQFHARQPFVVVPEVIGHRCSKRVLTLAYEPGEHAHEIEDAGYTQEERDRCGRHLWEAVESQIFDHRAIHADPNPANFAFRRDGSVVMYDFGCVKRLDPKVVEGYRTLLVRGLAEDYDAIEQALLDLGVRKPSGPRASDELYKLARDWLAIPFLQAPLFDFGTARFEHELVAKLAPAVMQNMASFQPTSELVFLNRALVGHYAILRKLSARVPVGQLLGAREPGAAQFFRKSS